METRIRWSAETRKAFNRITRVYANAAGISLLDARAILYPEVDNAMRQKESRLVAKTAFHEADYPRVKRG